MGQPRRETGAEESGRHLFAHHQFTRLGRKFGYDGAGRRILLERQQARDFERKDVVIRVIVGEDDAGMRNRPLLLARMRQQFLRGLDRRGNIAAAENGGIGKPVDEVNDQQAAGWAQIERCAESLPLIGLGLFTHGAQPA